MDYLADTVFGVTTEAAASGLTKLSTRFSTAGGQSFLWVRLVCLHFRFDFGRIRAYRSYGGV